MSRVSSLWPLLLVAVVAFVMGECDGRRSMGEGVVSSDTARSVRVDTAWRTDSVPVPGGERVVHYVRVPAKPQDVAAVGSEDSNSTARDSVSVPIVQREYSDSGYVAWVSGPAIDSLGPRLDSIRVREITRRELVEVTNTLVKKPPRVSVGLVGGYGVGLQSGRVEPFVGVGVSWRLWPK